jgi:hypothetical protein
MGVEAIVTESVVPDAIKKLCAEYDIGVRHETARDNVVVIHLSRPLTEDFIKDIYQRGIKPTMFSVEPASQVIESFNKLTLDLAK